MDVRPLKFVCFKFYLINVKCANLKNSFFLFNKKVDVGKTGCLDFGDLPGGSTKALPLKLVNRTHATVPVRLVISAVSEICQHLVLKRLLNPRYV